MPDGWTLVKPAATQSADGWTLVQPKTVSAEDFSAPALPYKGARVPGDTWAEKLGNIASVLGNEAVGFAKGAGKSALGIGQMAIDAGIVPGQTPSGFNASFQSPTLQKAGEDIGYSNDPAQRFGGKLETAAEFAAPAMDVAKGAVALAPLAKTAIAKAAPWAGSLATDVALHALGVGPAVTPAKIIAKGLRKGFGDFIESSKALNTLGDVPGFAEDTKLLRAGVKPADLPVRRPLPDAPLPRQSTPKPKMAKMDIDTAIKQVKAANPEVVWPDDAVVPSAKPSAATRPYFLRSPEEVAAVRASAAEAAAMPAAKRSYFMRPQAELEALAGTPAKPTGEINFADLPEVFKTHTSQNIFPRGSKAEKEMFAVTGPQGAEMAAAFKAHVKDSGLTIGQALAQISKNPNISTVDRQFLIKALTKGSK